jgi:hypothetical protein
MSDKKETKFAARAFISVGTGASFLVLATSGIVLFVGHGPGSGVFGIGAAQWKALHLWFSVAFLTACLFHVWMNWSPLVGYFRSHLTRRLTLRREWLLAVALCGVIFVGTLGNMFPFSLLSHNPATITLAEMAAHQGLAAEQLLTDLRARGIVVASADVTIGEIAEQEGMTPEQFFRTMFGERRRD